MFGIGTNGPRVLDMARQLGLLVGSRSRRGQSKTRGALIVGRWTDCIFQARYEYNFSLTFRGDQIVFVEVVASGAISFESVLNAYSRCLPLLQHVALKLVSS